MIVHARRRLMPAAAAMMAALLLAACQTGGGNSPVARSASGGAVNAIAFESIDGPPKPVFDRLVSSLGTEADSRNIRVVSREANVGYRVRGYLAASVEDNKGTVDWVWDVFDKDRVRVLRVAGSRQVGKGSDVWSRIDDEMAGRIASESLTEIASVLGGAPAPRPAETATPPASEPEAPPAVRTDDGPPVATLEPAASPSGTLALASDP